MTPRRAHRRARRRRRALLPSCRRASSRAGHRPPERQRHGGPVDLLPVNGTAARADAQDRQGRPRPCKTSSASPAAAAGRRPTRRGCSIALKPLAERKIDVTHVIARLRPKLAHIPGATLYLQPSQDIRAGGRSSNATYQYTLQGDNYDEISLWAPKLLAELQKDPHPHRRQQRPAKQRPPVDAHL